jgi:hypothetical protein
MIVTKSKEELELEKELEEKKLAQYREDKALEREFQIDKLKIEVSSAARWRGIASVLESIFTLPLAFLWLICVTLIILFKREVPEFLKDIDIKKNKNTIK